MPSAAGDVLRKKLVTGYWETKIGPGSAFQLCGAKLQRWFESHKAHHIFLTLSYAFCFACTEGAHHHYLFFLASLRGIVEETQKRKKLDIINCVPRSTC